MHEATRRCLLKLSESRQLALSSFGRVARREIEPLLDARVLNIVRSGAGEAVQVQNPAALDQFMLTHFPENDLPDALPARAKAVREMRNSKQAGDRESTVLLLRAWQHVECSLEGQALDVATITRQCGAVALVLTPHSRLTMRGKVGLIENQECFLHAERMHLDVDLVIYTAGRLSRIVLSLLAGAGMRHCTYLHCPDYDPVGLTEYMRYKALLKERLRLHIPDTLRTLLQTYGKRALLEGRNGQIMRLLRNKAPRELRDIIEWMDEANAGLEQEILIHCHPMEQWNDGRLE